jgi:hypothetical protein
VRERILAVTTGSSSVALVDSSSKPRSSSTSRPRERRLDVEWRGAPVNTDLLADSARLLGRDLLPVRIGSPLGLLLGDIAIALRSLVGFTQVSPGRVASLCPTLLATTHRRRDEQHKEHDCDRDDDHDDAGTHREDCDKGDAQDPISSIACSSVSP